VQLVKPEVAERSAVPPTPKLIPVALPGFSELMWFSTFGVPVGEGLRLSTPNTCVVDTVPSLRSPIPGAVFDASPLPADVLPEISRHTVVLVAVVSPESIRIPGRKPASGAATVLLRMRAVIEVLPSRTAARMPLASVLLMLLPEIVVLSVAVSPMPEVSPAPTLMPRGPPKSA
jgi:hypothetical protein